MARYKLILAYDGSDFFGFQRQKSRRTVQGVVEKALKAIGWSGTSLLGAGRTDTGVHALGQVVSFDLKWAHSLDALRRAVNTNLPEDAVVRSVEQVSDSFHPRFDAVSRLYRYHIFFEEVRNPFRERFAWRIWPEFPPEILQPAAELLIGEHDFAAFGTPPTLGGTTNRKVVRSEWKETPSGIEFEIEANAFLYHMVRRTVRLLVDVAQEKVAPERVIQHLKLGSDDPVRGLAPPNGLFLAEARYEMKGIN